MSWNEATFGKILYPKSSTFGKFARFKYSRIPNLSREYYITTRGLVIRGGPKGPGDLLTWDMIKEPGTSDGLQFLGLDLAGTVKFNTPITMMVACNNGRGKGRTTSAVQEFPQMSTDFYYKLVAAWNVARMFPDGSNRRKALEIWSKHINDKSEKTRGDYLKEIYTGRINEIFYNNVELRDLALEMYEKGKLKKSDFEEKTDYEIKEKVKKYQIKQNGIGFHPQGSTSSNNSAQYRESMRVSPTPNNRGKNSAQSSTEYKRRDWTSNSSKYSYDRDD